MEGGGFNPRPDRSTDTMRHNAPSVLPLWAVAAWLNNRGYRQSYRTLRALLQQPACPLRLRTWCRHATTAIPPPLVRSRASAGGMPAGRGGYLALAEHDLPRLVELLGPPPHTPRQQQLPL